MRADLPGAGPEAVEVLARGEACRVERIVSQGHASPEGFWYDQAEDEYVLVLEGHARLELESGEIITLRPGDWLDIPAGLRHRVAWTAPDEATIWLAFFYARASDSV